MIPRGIIPGILGALLALGALHLLGWRPAPDVPHYPRVQTDSAAIVQHEPTPEPGRIQQITRPVSRPEVVATAPGAAAGDVFSFCSAAGWSLPEPLPAHDPETANQEPSATVPAPTAATEPRSGLPPALQVQQLPQSLIRSGTIGRRATDLWGVSSSGNLWRASYQVRAPVSFRVAGDSVVVQGSRFWWLHALAPVAICAGGGVLSLEIGSLIPVAAGCGIGAYVAVR